MYEMMSVGIAMKGARGISDLVDDALSDGSKRGVRGEESNSCIGSR